jgi:hypothetical protein
MIDWKLVIKGAAVMFVALILIGLAIIFLLPRGSVTQ